MNKQLNDSKKSSIRKKRILFLGSSVTRGYASNGISFVDLLDCQENLIVVKNAVDGTCLRRFH